MKEIPIRQQRIKVLNKLFDMNYKTEKDLQSLDAENILKIPNITIEDFKIILEIQKQTKANKLFSYLGDGIDD